MLDGAAMRRPRGPRKLRSPEETKPSVARRPRPPGLASATTGARCPARRRLPAHRGRVARCRPRAPPGRGPGRSRRPPPRSRRPSWKETVTSSRRRLWALVSTWPSPITTPEPWPQPRPRPTTEGPTARRPRRSCPEVFTAFIGTPRVTCKLLVTITRSTHRARWPRAGNLSPLAAALDSVGDRWTLLLVEALLDGPRALRRPPGAAARGSPRTCSPSACAGSRARAWSGAALQRAPAALRLRAHGLGPRAGRAPCGSRRLGRAPPREGGEPPRHDVCGTPVEARWWCPTCERPVDDDDAGACTSPRGNVRAD